MYGLNRGDLRAIAPPNARDRATGGDPHGPSMPGDHGNGGWPDPRSYGDSRPAAYGREVRPDRDRGERHPGKRGWAERGSFMRTGGSFGNGNGVEPPSKRRITGRPFYAGENGRFASGLRVGDGNVMIGQSLAGENGLLGRKFDREAFYRPVNGGGFQGGGAADYRSKDSDERRGYGREPYLGPGEGRDFSGVLLEPVLPQGGHCLPVYNESENGWDKEGGSRLKDGTGWDLPPRERDHRDRGRPKTEQYHRVTGPNGVPFAAPHDVNREWAFGGEKDQESGRIDRYGRSFAREVVWGTDALEGSRDGPGRIWRMHGSRERGPLGAHEGMAWANSSLQSPPATNGLSRSPMTGRADLSTSAASSPAALPPLVSPVSSAGPPVTKEESPSSPPKRTRLGWGQGLAKYEKKKHVEGDGKVCDGIIAVSDGTSPGVETPDLFRTSVPPAPCDPKVAAPLPTETCARLFSTVVKPEEVSAITVEAVASEPPPPPPPLPPPLPPPPPPPPSTEDHNSSPSLPKETLAILDSKSGKLATGDYILDAPGDTAVVIPMEKPIVEDVESKPISIDCASQDGNAEDVHLSSKEEQSMDDVAEQTPVKEDLRSAENLQEDNCAKETLAEDVITTCSPQWSRPDGSPGKLASACEENVIHMVVSSGSLEGNFSGNECGEALIVPSMNTECCNGDLQAVSKQAGLEDEPLITESAGFKHEGLSVEERQVDVVMEAARSPEDEKQQNEGQCGEIVELADSLQEEREVPATQIAEGVEEIKTADASRKLDVQDEEEILGEVEAIDSEIESLEEILMSFESVEVGLAATEDLHFEVTDPKVSPTAANVHSQREELLKERGCVKVLSAEANVTDSRCPDRIADAEGPGHTEHNAGPISRKLKKDMLGVSASVERVDDDIADGRFLQETGTTERSLLAEKFADVLSSPVEMSKSPERVREEFDGVSRVVSEQTIVKDKQALLDWRQGGLALPVLSENWEKARKSHEGLHHIWASGMDTDGRPLYRAPCEAPYWAENERQHAERAPELRIRVAREHSIEAVLARALAVRYRALREGWKMELANRVSRRERGLPEKTHTKHSTDWSRNSYQMPSSLRTSLRLRRNTSPDGGDTDATASLHGEGAEELAVRRMISEPLEASRSVLQMPAMILGSQNCCLRRFISNNGRVEDPVGLEMERKRMAIWTVEERSIFLEKFAQLNKNFAAIASFLEHKTVADCVEFYYRNQKSDDFERVCMLPM